MWLILHCCIINPTIEQKKGGLPVYMVDERLSICNNKWGVADEVCVPSVGSSNSESQSV